MARILGITFNLAEPDKRPEIRRRSKGTGGQVTHTTEPVDLDIWFSLQLVDEAIAQQQGLHGKSRQDLRARHNSSDVHQFNPHTPEIKYNQGWTDNHTATVHQTETFHSVALGHRKEITLDIEFPDGKNEDLPTSQYVPVVNGYVFSGDEEPDDVGQYIEQNGELYEDEQPPIPIDDIKFQNRDDRNAHKIYDTMKKDVAREQVTAGELAKTLHDTQAHVESAEDSLTRVMERISELQAQDPNTLRFARMREVLRMLTDIFNLLQEQFYGPDMEHVVERSHKPFTTHRIPGAFDPVTNAYAFLRDDLATIEISETELMKHFRATSLNDDLKQDMDRLAALLKKRAQNAAKLKQFFQTLLHDIAEVQEIFEDLDHHGKSNHAAFRKKGPSGALAWLHDETQRLYENLHGAGGLVVQVNELVHEISVEDKHIDHTYERLLQHEEDHRDIHGDPDVEHDDDDDDLDMDEDLDDDDEYEEF